MAAVTVPEQHDESETETLAGFIVIRDFDGTEQRFPVRTVRRPKPPQQEEM
jgi:hypothetical protein